MTENLNPIIRNLRDDDAWVWVLGDDHVWEGDCLDRPCCEAMDDNPDIDVLVPLVTKRNPPWHLVLFHEAGEHARGRHARLAAVRLGRDPRHGVFEVDAAGRPGC